MLIGDFMLDIYVYGDALRISPEAPVPVLKIVSREYNCGGAASVAADIAALKAEGVAIDAGFRGFVDRGERRCRKVGLLDHSRAAAERTLLLHHPVLLEGEATIDRLARGMQKISRAEVHGELGAAGDSG